MTINYKKTAKILIIAGVVLATVGLLLPIMNSNASTGSVGIIGGAGLPTYMFLFSRMWGGLPLMLTSIGLLSVAVGVIALLAGKNKG